jgi:hypothetical protein
MALLIFNLDDRWSALWPLYPRTRAPVHIVQVTAWDPGLVWTRVEKKKYLEPIVVRTLNHPAIYIMFIALQK